MNCILTDPGATEPQSERVQGGPEAGGGGQEEHSADLSGNRRGSERGPDPRHV